MNWKLCTSLLCIYGVLKEFRPSEPYLYRYQRDFLHLSDEQLNGEVYPFWAYSFLITIVPVLFLTDVLLYKPVLLMENISYLCVWTLLIFGESVNSQRLAEFFYGFATAVEMAYFTYIYVLVDRQHFKRVTTLTRAALQAGQFIGYISSQPILLFNWGNLLTLNYITVGALLFAFFVALFLPCTEWSHIVELEPNPDAVELPHSYLQFVKDRLCLSKKHFCKAYQRGDVIKWSIWWACATCGEYFILNYSQSLWSQLQIDPHNKDILNGFVTAIVPLFAMIAIFGIDQLPVNWSCWGETCLTLACLADAGILWLMAITDKLWVMYVCFGIFQVLYQAMITVAQINVVTKITGSSSYGLVFGSNIFFALVIQSVLTLIFVDERGLGLAVRDQFQVYAGYHFVLGLIFLVGAIYNVCCLCICSRQQQISSSSFSFDSDDRNVPFESKSSFLLSTTSSKDDKMLSREQWSF